jgi:hypothetical protein
MDNLLRKQVCSLELSKALAERGVKQKSYFYWDAGEDVKQPNLITHQSDLILTDGYNQRNYSAFTCSELGELLLRKVESYTVYIFPDNLFNGRDENGTCEAQTEADLRALMLLRAID